VGLGAAEAFIAPGDSGGPSFINGRIAGVHSFTGRSATDIDAMLDSSFGEYAADISVSYNKVFIQSLVGSAPESKTMLLVGLVLVAFSMVGARRRQN
jgi:hypothetical protein